MIRNDAESVLVRFEFSVGGSKPCQTVPALSSAPSNQEFPIGAGPGNSACR